MYTSSAIMMINSFNSIIKLSCTLSMSVELRRFVAAFRATPSEGDPGHVLSLSLSLLRCIIP